MLTEALRLIRVFHDMKQNELATHLGISKSHLSEIESGKKQPSLQLIERYSSEFGIPAVIYLVFRRAFREPITINQSCESCKWCDRSQGH